MTKGLIDALQLEHGIDVATSEGRQVVGLDAALRTDEGISIAEVDLLLAVISKDPRALVPYLNEVAVIQEQANRFTRFATRMLGDVVEHGFEAKPGDPVKVGQTVGWVEGFKALTDVYCVADGIFAGGNPDLDSDPTLVDKDPYYKGWLNLVRRSPAASAFHHNRRFGPAINHNGPTTIQNFTRS